MSLSSVNIAALASLSAVVDKAHDQILADQETLKNHLLGTPVDLSGLARLPDIASWFHDQSGVLKRQLRYARWLEASTPGIQGTVRFDPRAMPDLDYATAKPLAQRALNLMKQGPPPSRELLDLMKQYGRDSTFALLMMHGWRKGYGYASSDAPPSPDLDYVKKLGKGKNSEKFLQMYSQMLGSLSSEFPSTRPFEADNPSDYRAMALLASRDSWDRSWLVQLGNGIVAAERADPAMWTKDLAETTEQGKYDDIPKVCDPTGLEIKDPLVWLMDAMSRNPQAAAEFFNGGGKAPIMADGHRVDVGANLRFVTLERAWPQDSGLSLALALGAAHQAKNAGFDSDLTALQHLDPQEKEHWYSFLGHLALDVVALIPELGELADAVNIAWYLAEGDYISAGAGVVAAIPVFGSTAIIAKWIRRIKKVAEATGKALDAKELKDLIDELPYTDQDPAKVPDPGGTPTSGAPAGSIFLNDLGEKKWYHATDRLERDATYVVGDVVFTTDDRGRIVQVRGDQSDLTRQEQAWIKEHSATR